VNPPRRKLSATGGHIAGDLLLSSRQRRAIMPMPTSRHSTQVGAVCSQQWQLRQRGRRRLAGLAAPLTRGGAESAAGSSARIPLQRRSERQGFCSQGVCGLMTVE
jgi:hypothetical protein